MASLLVTWVTFVPSFLFIFLGAPYIERLRRNRALAGALAGITAAVVGVIANLGVYFAVNTLFATVDRGPLALLVPDPATVRPIPLAIAAIAAILIFVAAGRCCGRSPSAGRSASPRGSPGPGRLTRPDRASGALCRFQPEVS